MKHQESKSAMVPITSLMQEAVRDYVYRKHLTQKEFAERLKMPASKLCRWLSGEISTMKRKTWRDVLEAIELDPKAFGQLVFIAKELPDLLRGEISAKGKSIEDIAAACQVSPTTVKGWLRGDQEMRLDTRKRLAEFLQIPEERIGASLPARADRVSVLAGDPLETEKPDDRQHGEASEAQEFPVGLLSRVAVMTDSSYEDLLASMHSVQLKGKVTKMTGRARGTPQRPVFALLEPLTSGVKNGELVALLDEHEGKTVMGHVHFVPVFVAEGEESDVD